MISRWRTSALAKALRALKQVVANPEDTPKVFEVLRALGLPAIRRAARRFRDTAVGRRERTRDHELIDVLRDRDALLGLPDGSLGRAYHDFVYREALSADGLAQASMAADAVASIDDPELARFVRRVRDQHDLWHTVTRYGRDTFGEVCLLAFTYAQTRNPGIALLALTGTWKHFQAVRSAAAIKPVWEAYRAGRHASWLPGEDWEQLLPLPISDVRRQLAVHPPEAYLETMETARVTAPAPAAERMMD